MYPFFVISLSYVFSPAHHWEQNTEWQTYGSSYIFIQYKSASHDTEKHF